MILAAQFVGNMNGGRDRASGANEKQWLCRNTSQAVSGGQAAKQEVGGSLKARCFDHCYDDQEIAQECQNTKRCVNTSCKNIVHEGRTVVGGKSDPSWQAAHSGSVALICHFLVTMTTYIRTEVGLIFS